MSDSNVGKRFRSGRTHKKILNERTNFSPTQVAEKTKISKAKLHLALHQDSDVASSSPVHHCTDCNFSLDEEAEEVLDNLPSLEENVPEEYLSIMVYIARYIARKSEDIEDTYVYYDSHGAYTRELNRGGLKIPGDNIVQWCIFCYVLFGKIKDCICRASAMRIFQNVADYYGFSVDKSHCRILSNILINLFCKNSTPRSRKEAQQKIIKLSG